MPVETGAFEGDKEFPGPEGPGIGGDPGKGDPHVPVHEETAGSPDHLFGIKKAHTPAS